MHQLTMFTKRAEGRYYHTVLLAMFSVLLDLMHDQAQEPGQHRNNFVPAGCRVRFPLVFIHGTVALKCCDFPVDTRDIVESDNQKFMNDCKCSHTPHSIAIKNNRSRCQGQTPLHNASGFSWAIFYCECIPSEVRYTVRGQHRTHQSRSSTYDPASARTPIAVACMFSSHETTFPPQVI